MPSGSCSFSRTEYPNLNIDYTSDAFVEYNGFFGKVMPIMVHVIHHFITGSVAKDSFAS